MEVEKMQTETNFNLVAWEQAKAERHNRTQGSMPHYNCTVCLNRGDIAYVGENGFMRLKRCVCVEKRKMVSMAKRTGAFELMQEKKFENFVVKTPWQQALLQAAQRFASSDLSQWFFVGGQSGAGKTHVCTAILSAVIKRNIAALYCVWPAEIRELTGAGFARFEETQQRFEQLCSVKVLYIDDLFKTADGHAPDKKQFDIAFEIINTRYNRKLTTILSSECSYLEIKSWNNAIAGRIRERCGEFEFTLRKGEEKDWRAAVQEKNTKQ